ncbi:aminoacyl--tRNA ligase-related protein [Cohnella faecalis]|uniref:aminoacyl--tRNA ligase-related protein n=1 Tax=Cohnella faecalis TaxID=2315694 RepID=UPI0036069031
MDGENQDIVIHANDDSNRSQIEDTVLLLMEQERTIRTLKSRVIRNVSTNDDNYKSPFPGASYHPDWSFASDGSVRRDFAVMLYQSIDGILSNLAMERHAKYRKYPSMIPLKTLDKCGYVTTFPQNIYLVSEIPHQSDILQKIKKTGDVESNLRQSQYALSPAVCFHCYEELAGQTLEHPVILTALGTCYRHEATWRLGNQRLNEFSMREVVLIGTPDFVESERNWWVDCIWKLFGDLGLTGRIETANDPFYFSDDAAKAQHQQMANMKYELVVEVDGGTQTFSIASFNNIREALCKPFRITDAADKPLHSGCIAFGIDRWVFSLLKKYGEDPGKWQPHIAEMMRFS